jgi:UrcA family protein
MIKSLKRMRAPALSTVLAVHAFAASALGVASYAAADDARPSSNLDPAVTIHFGDLNPSTSEGVHAIYGRIASAAHAVCGTSSSFWDANWHPARKVCYQAAMDHAVKLINLPKLTALHESKMHGLASQARLPQKSLSSVEIASRTD